MGLWAVLCISITAHAEKAEWVGVCPEPASCKVTSSTYQPLKKVSVACADEAALSWAKKHLKEWYGKVGPEVVNASRSTADLGNEAYNLEVTAGEVKITARTLQGVRYALYSLRQMAIPQRGTLQVEGWILPQVTIHDKPSLDFRGIHMCWFHESKPWEIERLIRLAAYYKLNYAVVESWGSFRSDVAPWYGWPDGSMTKKELKRLRKIADDLGITLIPQINVFGHATMSRGGAGKHAALEFNPQYQPLFEPVNGWNWCLSNPETRKLLQELIVEQLEAYGNPPYFHIGCDEALPPSCPACKEKPYSQLFLEHVQAMNETISSRGAKTMMWHDMLLQRGDNRWNGFYANGTAETAAGLLKLPRDIIICDWYYGPAHKAYPTIDYFKEQGFHVLACPWYDTGGIAAQGRYAGKAGLDGMLGTLWHHYFGYDLVDDYFTLSNVAWNSESSFSMTGAHYGEFFRTHLRQIGWDMHIKDSRHAGIYYDEVPPEPDLRN